MHRTGLPPKHACFRVIRQTRLQVSLGEVAHAS
jgi:hypothetical protein